MKPCGKPWSQLPIEEKVEALHKQLTSVVRTINRLARLYLNEECKNEEVPTMQEKQDAR